MKSKTALMMTGVVLAMSATTLPASATGSHINTQDRSGSEPQTQLLATMGVQMPQQKWSIAEQGVEGSQGSQFTPSEQADKSDRIRYEFRNKRTRK
jgi:2-keto-3-deoxy-6-phosphogluconate aldolase